LPRAAVVAGRAIAAAIGSGCAPAVSTISTATSILSRRRRSRSGLRPAALRTTAAALSVTTAAAIPLATAVVTGRALTLGRFSRVSECGRQQEGHGDPKNVGTHI
jgi:hypothetical protein